jgi:malto-oligosyltrehalose synthase
MDQVSAVLHDGTGETSLSALWTEKTGDSRAFAQIARDARREILDRLFPKQRDRLIAGLREVETTQYGDDTLRAAMDALLSAFRCYRLYGDENGFSPEDERILTAAAAEATACLDESEKPVLDWICARLRATGYAATEARQRFQQLSATLTAKAVEDTAFYRYGRLLSRNEVGSDPGRLAISPGRYHEYSARRQVEFPAALLATATHDHKRGEDHRARLAVLSEIPDAWRAFVKRNSARHRAPDAVVQLMIYQTVIGAWPLQFDRMDTGALTGFRDRVAQWLVKALREAKQQTSWNNPDEAFERACLDFLSGILNPGEDDGFLADVEQFVARIAPAGALNGLTQTLLRLTAPGVPDLYQGTEFWDFSLVDPDNRNPVDFASRQRALDKALPLNALTPDWRDGRIKQAVIARVLAFRKHHEELFSAGGYEPLRFSGPNANHLLGFIRQFGGEAIIVVVPRLAAKLSERDNPIISSSAWVETILNVPADLAGRQATEILENRAIAVCENLDVARVFGTLPLALLHIHSEG